MPREAKAPPAELPVNPAELLEQFGNGPMMAEAINSTTCGWPRPEMVINKALI